MIDTYSQTQPFQVFDNNIDKVSRIPVIAPRYSFVWGCANANTSRAWRPNNAAIDTSSYFPSGRDSDPTNRPLSWWIANHPDWILYKADKTTPAYLFGAPNVPLDVSNSAVVSWQVSTIVQTALTSNTFTYMAADNLTLTNDGAGIGVYAGATPGNQFSGVWTPLYSGANHDPTYETMLSNWCASMASQCHANGINLCINFGLGSFAYTDTAVVNIANAVDALMDEQGFTAVGTANLSGSAWLNKISFMKAVQAAGHQYLLINVLPDTTRAAIQWGLASYLMGKYHHASIALVPLSGGTPIYGTEEWYAEYDTLARIGTPTEDMTADQNIYRRTFTGGLALVNNDPAITYTYTLPAKLWKDLYGTYYSGAVTLPATSALILLDMTPRAFL